jgi:4-aminobutyrate aminotransferase
LAERLIDLVSGDWQKKVWYGLSCSDASEAAMRLLPQATGRNRLVSFVGSWHGAPDGTIGLSAHPDPYHPLFLGTTENLTDRCLHYLEHSVPDNL